MKEFICDNGEIKGTALKEHWFKVNTADIFISHSHRDINKVRAFAGWLYHNFGLEAFIDSCTWGYADDCQSLCLQYSNPFFLNHNHNNAGPYIR